MGGAHIQEVGSQCRRITVSITDAFACEAVLVRRGFFNGDFFSRVTTLHKANEQSFHLLGSADCFQ